MNRIQIALKTLSILNDSMAQALASGDREAFFSLLKLHFSETAVLLSLTERRGDK